ncbi:uncharacterized protein LOC123554324 [Mercenaria mercenaria]|uniref:uncharacterized protein LOC123554324 n=1 Tax=Mercenaria mercenaria TaxID=6596 RepID=UPI00234F6236|nr:uncharacterized protein LOC123554324 [Mercenaria mercenaria]
MDTTMDTAMSTKRKATAITSTRKPERNAKAKKQKSDTTKYQETHKSNNSGHKHVVVSNDQDVQHQQINLVDPQQNDSDTKCSLRDGIVDLNVGGKLMTTFVSTLTKEPKSDTLAKGPKSKLAVMFSRPEDIPKDKDGRCFIDCDGEVFTYILNFLRSDTLPPQERALEVYDLASEFKLQSLVEQLEHFYAIQYRSKIAKIKEHWKGNGNTKFEQLKQEIVDNMHCSPRRDITIYETSESGGCDFCPISPAHVFLLPASNMFERGRADERRALLIYDLCALGFAKSIVTKKIDRRCDNCNVLFEGFEIVLVAQ